MSFSGSLSDSLGRPPQFKTRRHKLGVGTHEGELTAIRVLELQVRRIHLSRRSVNRGERGRSCCVMNYNYAG